MNNKKTGNIGEDFAESYLKNKGHFVLERNFRTPFGEIDIITFFHNSIYIYEVKYRKNLEYGFGDDAITPQKVNKIRKTFEVWISQNQKNYNFKNIYLNALIIDPDGKINEFEVM